MMARITYSVLTMMFVLGVSCAFAQQQSVVDAHLERLLNSSQDLKAVDLDIKSLQQEIAARDLELSPAFQLELNRYWDRRPSTSSNPESFGRTADLLLTQPLHTGTELSLSSGLEASSFRADPSIERKSYYWQVGLSQSLWQNAFGRQTAFRRERDQEELHSRWLQLMVKRQQVLLDVESAYWNLAYGQQEVNIRRENLERSLKILTWIKDRFERSAATRSDLLQAEALRTTRELQLQLAEDNFKSLKSQLREKIEVDESFSASINDLRNERSIISLVMKSNFAPKDPVLIESLQSKYEAKRLQAQYKFETEDLKPVLEVGYSFGKRGLDNAFSHAARQAFSGGDDYHQIGILFSVPLNFGLLAKSRDAARLKAEAQAERQARFERQSDLQWEDLKRTVEEKQRRVKTAMALAELHQAKSAEERSLYEKGRSTAFQSITFEQEASESALLVLQLLAELKRTEAKAYLFIQHVGM